MTTTTRWLQLRSFFPGSSAHFAVVAALSVVGALLVIPVPIVVQYVLDDAVPSMQTTRILGAGSVLVALLVASEAVGLLRRILIARHGKTAIRNLRHAMVQKLHDMHIQYHRRTEPVLIRERIVQQTTSIDAMVQELLATVVPAIILAAGMAGVLLSIHWIAFVEALLLVPTVYAIYRFFQPRIVEAQRKRDADYTAVNDGVMYSLRSIELTRSHGTESVDMEHNDDLLDTLRSSDERVRVVRGIYRATERTALVIFATVILGTLGVASAHGDITLGGMFSFFVALALLVIPIGMTIAAAPIAREGISALVDVTDFLSLEMGRPYQGSIQLDNVGTISLANIAFSYGDEALLTDVSLDLTPGTVTMVAGPNGSGKSTIIGLILGLFRPDRGQVSMDGIPYDDLDITALRQEIGLVAQEPTIVAGSIADNIKYGAPEVSDVEMWQAAHLSTVDDFIVDFPGGYDHELGFDGRTLSGGQRQRIAIARALVRNPQLLILDEPTSHLDAGTLGRIIANISRLPKKPTVVMTSHHPRAIGSVDRLFRVEGRRLVEDMAIGSQPDEG